MMSWQSLGPLYAPWPVSAGLANSLSAPGSHTSPLAGKEKTQQQCSGQVGGQQSIVYESICRYSTPKNGRSERGNCTRAVFASFFFFFFFCKLVFSGRRILAQ